MPVIKLENCTKCLICVKDCPSGAIDIDAGTINDNCIHCGHCVAICPESTISPDDGFIEKLTPEPVHSDSFQRLSAGIRTCRSYKGKEVEEEKLKLLIDNMKHYPSASNARPVEITAVRNKENVQRLNDQTALVLMKSIRVFTSPLVMPILQLLAPDLDLPRLSKYKKQYAERNKPGSSLICHHAPLVLLFHAAEKKYSLADADANIWATYTSIYANTLGLGSCFNGFIVMAMKRSKDMRQLFNLPAGHQVYAALLIGHPKVKYANEAGRRPPRVQVLA